MAYNSANIFAKILKGEIPAFKIFETNYCIGILDAFPVVKGHSLLIPKAPVVNLFDMSEEVAASVLKELPRLVNAVKLATGADGITVVTNSGKAAGQVVFHSHFHIIPRFDNDGLISFTKSPSSSPITSPDADGILRAIQDNLSNSPAA